MYKKATFGFIPVLVLSMMAISITGITSPVSALEDPTTSTEDDLTAPAGFYPAPNPFTLCDSPTYFSSWPLQANGPWVSSVDPGSANAVTATATEISGIAGSHANNSHWGIPFTQNGVMSIDLSEPVFYSQWVFTDLDNLGAEFEADFSLGGGVASGGPISYGGDPAYTFSSSGPNNIVGTNTIFRPDDGWDLGGRLQIDFLGPIDRIDLTKRGTGISGVVAGSACEPLGISKVVSGTPVWNSFTGKWTVTYEIKAINNLPTEEDIITNINLAATTSASNSGIPDPIPTTPINNFQLVEDLVANFTSQVGIDSVNILSVTNPTAGLTINPSYDGVGDMNLLTGADALNPGQTESVQVVIEITPDLVNGTWPGTLEIEGNTSGSGDAGVDITDISDNGTNPAPGNDNDNPDGGTGHDDPTPVVLQMLALPTNADFEISKSVTSAPVVAADGSVKVGYSIEFENTGSAQLTDVQVSDDLIAAFGTGTTVTSSSVSTSAECAGDENSSWTGLSAASNNLLDAGVSLGISENCIINLELTLVPGTAAVQSPGSTTWVNTVIGSAFDLSGGDESKASSAAATGSAPAASTDSGSGSDTNEEPILAFTGVSSLALSLIALSLIFAGYIMTVQQRRFS